MPNSLTCLASLRIQRRSFEGDVSVQTMDRRPNNATAFFGTLEQHRNRAVPRLALNSVLQDRGLLLNPNNAQLRRRAFESMRKPGGFHLIATRQQISYAGKASLIFVGVLLQITDVAFRLFNPPQPAIQIDAGDFAKTPSQTREVAPLKRGFGWRGASLDRSRRSILSQPLRKGFV